MYSILYRTSKGGSGCMTNTDIDVIKKKAQALCNSRLPATIYKAGRVIGRVWEDNSQRKGWNWYIESDQ